MLWRMVPGSAGTQTWSVLFPSLLRSMDRGDWWRLRHSLGWLSGVRPVVRQSTSLTQVLLRHMSADVVLQAPDRGRD